MKSYFPQSENIKLVPLNETQLIAYARNDASLEHVLGLTYVPGNITFKLQEKFKAYFIPQVIDHKEDFEFYTIWIIIDTTAHMIVGGICFKGTPDENGWVEIGYETFAPFQRKGIMSTAVELLCTWAKDRGDVFGVRAETLKENDASQKVLLNTGFAQIGENDKHFIWEVFL